jgi:phenylpyruvate tautomerase PptA (4-oxalocrotonate tautomerase family)
MSFIKVHVSALELPAKKPLLVKRLREVMIKKLQLEEELGQVILYEAVPQHRACSSTGDSRYVFIEVVLHLGRTQETKNALMTDLVQETEKILEIHASHIHCLLQEVPAENWLGDSP